uniref:Uncharacterized protein n=2 Tax=Aegilops tauschii TaxID=37682 RepID=A0A453N2R5_AEGTS
TALLPISCHHPHSPAAPPLEDDNLLSEILLRLPSEPSSLSRASLVCKRWFGLVSDPGFSRRFRLHHRRNPPLLAFFDKFHGIYSAMEPPNRVPEGRFSLQLDDGEGARFLLIGCHQGLVLSRHRLLNQLLVWDPVTGDQHRFARPLGFETLGPSVHGAVLRAAGDVHHFQVVLVRTEISEQHSRAIASVYSSETGIWGNLMSTPLPPKASNSLLLFPPRINTVFPGVQVGDSLYWLLSGITAGILEFDLGRQSLSVIHVPVDIYARGSSHFTVMRADDGGLGFFFLSRFTTQLWKRKIDSDGVASWVMGRTFEIDKLFSLNSLKWGGVLTIRGFAEDNNVVFLSTATSLFMLQLESLQLKKLFDTTIVGFYHPFESVYAAGSLLCDVK